ncbi:Bacteriophage lambda, GpH, tail tape measure, C-terminal [uncultured Caudovirales phage]|uniref:Bacteriophage lambda, GpH, tail tape measure, C-terminal n=1 Tax=uncultured Caudovirales phage TaxID=2100421 RepID=A0A6J7X4N7_9CAUD|nr:Bacteriophage lambda, GpH, tail tape measure, C-terminal [uncultured Caudovirales phage]
MATIEDFILRIKVQGTESVKGLSGGINNLKKDVEGFAPTGGAFSNVLSGITGKLGGAGTAILGVSAAIAALGLKAVQIADQLQDISDATGVAAGALSNFQASIIEAGGKSEDFANIATKLNQTLGDAAMGNEAAQKSFQKLGVFVRDANGNVRDTGDVLRDVLGKLKEVSDPATRAALAVELLGKKGKEIDWTKVNAINDPFKDESVAALARFQGKIDSLNNSIKDGLITTFGQLFILMENGFEAKRLDGYLASFQSMVLGMVGVNKTAADILEEQRKRRVMFGLEKDLPPGQRPLPPGVKPSTAGAGRGSVIPTGPGGDFGDIPEATKKAIEESNKRIAQSGIEARKLAELKGANDLQAIQVNAAAEIAKAREEIFTKERLSDEQKTKEFAAKKAEIEAKAATDTAKYRSQQNAKIYSELEAQRQKAAEELAAEETRINNIIESTRQISVEQQYQLEAQQRKNTSLSESLGLSDREKKNAQEIFALEEERLALLRKIAETKDLPYEQRLKQEADVNAKIAERKELAKQNQDIEKKNAENFQAGYSTAYKNYIDASRNAAEQATRLFQTFTSSFEDSLVKSFSKGKLLWKEFLLDMVQQLLRSNIQSMLGNFFGSAQGNSSANMLGTILKGLSGFANGGMIPTNAPVLVGERGPEILMGAAGRTVIPNSGIGGSNVTYNINAVDAMSFKAMIAADPTFLYAVSEQGRRRLPGGM